MAKAAGIKIIAVGIGHNVDQYELWNIASDPYKDVYTFDKFDEVPHKLSRMIKC